MLHRLTILVLGLSMSLLVAAEEWPQWRGPNRDGISPGEAWPDNFDNLKEVYRIKDLGPSYSTPIVTENWVFTTETVDKKKEVVRCLDRKTGKEIWQKEWLGSLTVPFFAARNGSWIRATPAWDGQALYVAGICDVLVCLEGKDGKERWRVDIAKELGTGLPTFGFVSSPLVDETGVYVQAGLSVVKLDKTTGKILWKNLKESNQMMGSAFASPVFGRVAGQDQLLVQTRSRLAGLDRKEGTVLWEKPIVADKGMNILTPVQHGDGIFTSSYGGKTQMISLSLADGKPTPSESWSFKYEGYMTTPVVVDGHAYFFGKDRRFICVNLKDGKETWRSDKRFGEYWSLVARKDKILALDANGTLYLIKANPKEFEILAEKKISKAETWAHVVSVGNEVYIRDLEGLTRFDWTK